MKSSDIRKAFIEYFAHHGHAPVPSSSLVPGNDPTLLFTNAGMVQFKDIFLGHETRPYSRAVSIQRCLRAGGKHNDLENVGYTARHHTFFEMLGNFSFGDYFKREAIAYAWEFLTVVLKLPVERLWITVFRDDDEAADIWLNEIGVSASRLSRCDEKDNFWSMGDTGPCGPCTEIFYDHGPAIAGGPPGTPDGDGDRYIEIWNLVFMQFNRDSAGVLHPLPRPSVDTGMGLERVAAVVQDVYNNYDTDTFQYLIKAIAAQLQNVDINHPSLKVVADHLRACAFLIADGVLPSNEGRGYVLRRIIRRAVRHGHHLGLPTPFFYLCVTALIDVMGDAYPELVANKKRIEQVLQQEEHQFARTLEQGLALLHEQIKELTAQTIPGDVAFKLYDTYGFPLDLTADIAREMNLDVDMDGFEHCMQQQRQQSKQASNFQVDYSTLPSVEAISTFCGYEEDALSTSILALYHDGKSVSQISVEQSAAVVLEVTPFYAESGGQVGDTGYLLGSGIVFRVDDTQRQADAIVHFGVLLEGSLRVGAAIGAEVDISRRNTIRLNHTATHLLHAALKQVCGAHVQQKGSLVDAARARFDFSHTQALTKAEIMQLELLVNYRIRMNEEVITRLMTQEAAKSDGAIALFGEKYTDVVRVLTMGDFSKELCGGTHARRTGDIGLFKITAEYGVATGVRRIEIVTGAYALAWVQLQLDSLDNISELLKTTPNQVVEKVAQNIADLRHLAKIVTNLQNKLAMHSVDSFLHNVRKIGGVDVLVQGLVDIEPQLLRDILDKLKSKMPRAVIVLFVVFDGKISVVAGVSKELLGTVPSAADFVRHLCGKGGGRADMAQGGGDVPTNLEDKVASLYLMIDK